MEDLRFELFYDTVYTLVTLFKKHFQVSSDVLREYGNVTKAHVPLLLLVHGSSGITMSEAARRLGLSNPHITLQVDRLVEEGLLERRLDAEDRRLVSIGLTPGGSELVQRLKGMMKEKSRSLFTAFSDETLERTLGALLTLREIMMTFEARSRPQGRRRARRPS